MTLTPINSGWIEVICGSMFSGKTEELIRRLRRAQIAQMPTIIFKPRIDSRYSDSHIVSHNQIKLESHLVNTPQDILPLAENARVVAIDEAQFFDDSILDVCKILASQGKRVVVAGLDTDYRGVPLVPCPNSCAKRIISINSGLSVYNAVIQQPIHNEPRPMRDRW